MSERGSEWTNNLFPPPKKAQMIKKKEKEREKEKNKKKERKK